MGKFGPDVVRVSRLANLFLGFDRVLGVWYAGIVSAGVHAVKLRSLLEWQYIPGWLPSQRLSNFTCVPPIADKTNIFCIKKEKLQ